MIEETIADGLESVWEGETITAEESKEMKEADLVPAGKYEGQLEPVDAEAHIKVVATDSGDHPLEGRKVVRLHAKLFTDGGERHLFFDAYPSKVVATSKAGGTYIREESKNASSLYNATGLHGRPFSEVLRFAQENRLVYNVGVSKGRTDKETGQVYDPKNNIKGIYPVKEA